LPLTWSFLTPPFEARNGGACRSFFGSVATIGERVSRVVTVKRNCRLGKTTVV
jgi:hypothetical protein